jgi:hypothetical protein
LIEDAYRLGEAMGLSVCCTDQAGPFETCVFSADSCLRMAVSERGFNSSPVGLAYAKAEDEVTSWWADCRLTYGD